MTHTCGSASWILRTAASCTARNSRSLFKPARERPHLELRRQQLSERRARRRVRSLVLEQRQHQPAGRDVRLLPPQHVSREQPARVPAALTMCGERIDLSRVTVPTYILATREDHIVPWKTAYQSTQLLGGDIRFVLAAQRPHRGRDQPALQEHAAITGPNTAVAKRAPTAWLRQRDVAARQLVAGLDEVARRTRRRHERPRPPRPAIAITRRWSRRRDAMCGSGATRFMRKARGS